MATTITRRKEKLKLAGQNSTKGQPGIWYVAGCPECSWRNSSLRKQNEPVHVAVQGDERFVQCPNGHKWKLRA